MKRITEFWGVIPIGIFLFNKMIVLLIELSFDVVLRGVPALMMFWFMIVAILLLIIYVIMKFFSMQIVKRYTCSQVVKYTMILLYCVGAFITIGAGVIVSGFTYAPEEVVMEDNQKMISRDTSYLDYAMEYYEYKNALFRGKQMISRDTSYLDYAMEYYEYKNALFRGKQILKKVSNDTFWRYNSEGELIETGEIIYSS